MKPVFCKDTENFTRFMASIRKVETRGAAEAGWMLAIGEPGLGKSRALSYYAIQKDCVHIRAKAAWTVNWLLRDIMGQIGERPKRRSEGMFQQALMHFAMTRQTLVVDEIENAMHDTKVLETLRDLSDMTEIPVIIAGMKGVDESMKRHPHIYSRIADICRFTPAEMSDARALCDALCEVKIADDLVAHLHHQAGGYHREIVNGIAEIERQASRHGKTEIGLTDIAGVKLTNDGRRAARAAQAA